MIRSAEFLVNQTKALLDNRLHALLAVALLTVMPLTSWLAAALIALMTLRKGEQAGMQAFIVALTLSSALLLKVVPVPVAFGQSLVDFAPCFLAAIVLRKTGSWRLVCGSIAIQAALTAWLVQVLAPDFISGLFLKFKTALLEFDNIGKMQALFSAFKDTQAEQTALDHLFFSGMITSVAILSLMSLLFARFVQAKCFNPGGFRKEMMGFRGGRLAFFILPGLYLAAYNQIYLAIDILPLIFLYFLAAGFALAFFMLAEKKLSGVMMLSLISLLIKPIIMFPVYIIFGSLDSLFNFRVYLLAKARKSV